MLSYKLYFFTLTPFLSLKTKLENNPLIEALICTQQPLSLPLSLDLNIQMSFEDQVSFSAQCSKVARDTN